MKIKLAAYAVPANSLSTHSSSGKYSGSTTVDSPFAVVIDADDSIRVVLERCLQRKGFRVRQADNLDEALILAQKQATPVLLVDDLHPRWLAEGDAEAG